MSSGNPSFNPHGAAPGAQTITPPHQQAAQATQALNTFRQTIGNNVQMGGGGFDDDEEEGEESLSSIKLTIHAPLVINGSGNLVAHDSSAAANAIALGVVNALRQLSMGQHGIPMIDEQGRPRPLTVEVLAETDVDGHNNVVGEKAVLARMMDMRNAAKERAAAMEASAKVKAEEAQNIMIEDGVLVKAEKGESKKRDHIFGEDCAMEVDSKRYRHT